MDNADEKSNWTIKDVPVETRQLALKAAKKQGLSVAQWLANGVPTLANLQDGNAVLPPAKPGQREAERAEAPEGQQPDYAGLAAAMREAINAYQAAGLEVPQAAVRQYAALIRGGMVLAKQALLQPPRPKRTRPPAAINGRGGAVQIEGVVGPN